MCMFDMEKLVF